MSEASNIPNFTPSVDDASPVAGSNRQEEQDTQQHGQQRLPSERLFDKLAELGITKVTVGFKGWHEMGHVRYMLTDRSPASTGIALTEAKFDERSVYFAIQEFVLGHLDAEHTDWRKENGSFGTYTLDVERREVNENFMVRETNGPDSIQEYDEERDKQRRDNLFTRLTELGVTKIIVQCEGGGDSGQIVSAEPTMEPHRTAPILKETGFEGKPIWDALEDMVLTRLTDDHPGWEQDCGSDATYIVNVARRRITCKFFQPSAEIDLEDEDEDDEAEDDEAGSDDAE